MDTSTFQSIIIDILILIVCGLLVYFSRVIYYILRWFKLRINLHTHQMASNCIGEVVRNAVIFTNNTYVDKLKKENRFDERCQNNARIQTRNIIKSEINPLIYATQGANVQDLDKWLDLLIEYHVHEAKHA